MIFKPTFEGGGVPLGEYPRPQFRRDSYLPLNGEWEYAITASAVPPKEYDGHIVVPYSPESALSGVGRQLKSDEFMHYRRTFALPEGFNRGRVIINFGACDQICTVFCNGTEAGRHEGGYLPFSFDITEHLKDGPNQLMVVVTDDASSDVYGRGKQSYKRGGIWYTAISGIWQSVWLESVPPVFLDGLKMVPDHESKTLCISCRTVGGEGAIDYAIYDGEQLIAARRGAAGGEVCTLDVSACKPWSPDSPELYRVVIECGDDKAESYFGLRSFSRQQRGGRQYFALNGLPIFQSGLLDQGYWGEGIYTPASNREMFDCLVKVKALGFNMLRKHIKIEPMLWYYYCDILGILVWQDMVNGGDKYRLLRLALGPFLNLHLDDANYKKMGRGNARSRGQYRIEAAGTAGALYNCVCICQWTLFNEGCGQFDSLKICEQMRALDGTRLYDHASGWQDMGGGDFCSRHVYFRKVKLKNDGVRILALTEFGGYSFKNGEGRRVFSYKHFANRQKFMAALKGLYLNEVVPAIREQALCAAVYTQLSDVEDEVNGIFTPDWQCKVDGDEMRAINSALYAAFEQSLI